MTLLQLLANHARPASEPVPAEWLRQFRAEQRVLVPVAGLPRVVRSLVTGGR